MVDKYIKRDQIEIEEETLCVNNNTTVVDNSSIMSELFLG